MQYWPLELFLVYFPRCASFRLIDSLGHRLVATPMAHRLQVYIVFLYFELLSCPLVLIISLFAYDYKRY